MSDERVTLAIHPKTGRPACVLLQAAFGFDNGELHRAGFDADDWISGEAGDPPIEELVAVTGTREQLRGLAEKLAARRRAEVPR